MRRTLLLVIAATVLAMPLVGLAQIYPPRPGVEIPRAYFDRVREDRTAFQFQRAWIQKVQRIKENREGYIAQRGFYHRQLLAPGQEQQFTVTGTVQVPVFMVKYSNTGADPYPISTMQTKLFDGPFTPQTLTDYYDEVSYGDLNMTGTVYGWTTLANVDTYYEGGCQGLCGSAKVGELIVEALTAHDPAVDFGIYDNDGPDGVPNSGDDDGYVDFAAFVHPEAGAECGNSNIWSHRWGLSGWGGVYTSDDDAAGGGKIKVDDYVIQPAYNCGGATVIDIGVFCHEFGHALSLPDLYDTNGGSAGIGHWGLMGSGSWNSVTQPAHMCAWSKADLGWSNVVVVEGKKQPYTIENVELNREVYRLNVADERWRRMTPCAISGSASMRCGLTAAEGTARGWAQGDGYGNEWIEKVSRDFGYDGSNPVTLQYDYTYDSEATYDFTHIRIDVNGTVSTLVSYDGTGSGTENLDLTPYLNGSGASTYTISFEFESDPAWSDRDGGTGSFNTTCGPFVFDDLSVTGGGEAYSTDFEAREDGWCVDMSEPAEYFLVENRQPAGSDINLWGGGGLAIWHINQDVTRTGQSGNTGGTGGGLPHGVKLEQADNLDHLGSNANRGDGGDPFPGNTANSTFDNLSAPSSLGYNATSNNACVTNISANPSGVNSMTADMAGGYGLPTYVDHNPKTGDNNTAVVVTIDGAGMACGMTAELALGTVTTICC
jgi:M6 family metalloprotease-like protein